MKGLKFVLILTGIMVFFSAGTGWSEENEKKMYTLDEIVVTATKTEKKIEDVPGSVTVITAEEMELRNMDTVDDALSNMKGTFTKRNKGLMDSTSSVNMRGFKGNQYTLVLLDGQPLNDAYTGGVEWGSLLVSDIERIEVVRGAASALYGGNAMGGVISMITKTPQKLEASITGGYGTDNT
ncbi:MAG: TonB-dependent receptor, partial [Deltaproteobacteria bacterium]|nr:TonB-dependent receptor [Deltaproteobacteria bacterium]